MTRDETSKKLKKALSEHVKGIDPSSQALFSINRRIRDTDAKRNPIAFLRNLKPVYVFGVLTLAMLAFFTGVLVTRTTAPPPVDIQTATPVTDNEPLEAQVADVDSANAESAECLSSPSDKAGYVNIYFYCSENLIARYRPVSENPVESAIELLLAGPTQVEIELGFTSKVVGASEDLINEVTISNGWAVIDFSEQISEQPEASPQFLEQINETIFDFDDIGLIEYRINGKCVDISTSNIRNSCVSHTRQGLRTGNGDRRIVPLKEPTQSSPRIYTCPSTNSCESFSEVESTEIFRYTGEQRNSGSWLEVLTPSGEIGWVLSVAVSVQDDGASSVSDLIQIAQDVPNLASNQGFALSNAFSGVGVYIYHTTSSGGILLRNHIDNPAAAESAEDINFILEKYIGAVPIAEIAPPPQLDNLEFISLESGNDTINTYFDFRNGYAEIIAISIHPHS